MEIKLKCQDDKTFTIDVQVARLSRHINAIIEEMDVNGGTQTIVLTGVFSNVLGPVIEWAEHHKNDCLENGSARQVRPLPEWDRDFFQRHDAVLAQIFGVSCQLGIPDLQKMSSAAMMSIYRRSTPN